MSEYISLKPPLFGALETEELRRELGNHFVSSLHVPGQYATELEHRWRTTFGVRHAIAVSSVDMAFATCFAITNFRNMGGLVSSLVDHAVLNASTLFKNKLYFTDIGVYPNLGTFAMSRFTLEDRLNVSGDLIHYIVANHMFGYPAPIKALQNMAEKYIRNNNADIGKHLIHHPYFFIEDCTYASGSKIENEYVGRFGDLSVFSLNPGDAIHCGGPGAMICTQNEEMALRAHLFVDSGIGERYYLQTDQQMWGLNLRMTETQAIMALKSMEDWKYRYESRKMNAKIYFEKLDDVPQISLPYQPYMYEPNWTHFTLRVKDGERNNLQLWLLHHSVETTPYFYRPLHKQPAYQTPDKLDNIEHVLPTMMHIPCHHALEAEDLIRIVDLIKEYFEGGPVIDKFKENRPQLDTTPKTEDKKEVRNDNTE